MVEDFRFDPDCSLNRVRNETIRFRLLDDAGLRSKSAAEPITARGWITISRHLVAGRSLLQLTASGGREAHDQNLRELGDSARDERETGGFLNVAREQHAPIRSRRLP